MAQRFNRHLSMSDVLAELQKVYRLNGDTYSSYEVVGLIGRAINEIIRLRAEQLVLRVRLGEAS